MVYANTNIIDCTNTVEVCREDLQFLYDTAYINVSNSALFMTFKTNFYADFFENTRVRVYTPSSNILVNRVDYTIYQRPYVPIYSHTFDITNRLEYSFGFSKSQRTWSMILGMTFGIGLSALVFSDEETTRIIGAGVASASAIIFFTLPTLQRKKKIGDIVEY